MMKFNEALIKAHLVVNKKYPNSAFYEAQAMLISSNDDSIDGTIDETQARFAYALFLEDRTYTVIATYDENGNVVTHKYPEPWLEDVTMSPYISLTLDEALEILKKELGHDVIKAGPVTLRHQLYPGELEPRYFIGTLARLHTVGVYSGKVDVPLNLSKYQ